MKRELHQCNVRTESNSTGHDPDSSLFCSLHCIYCVTYYVSVATMCVVFRPRGSGDMGPKGMCSKYIFVKLKTYWKVSCTLCIAIFCDQPWVHSGHYAITYFFSALWLQSNGIMNWLAGFPLSRGFVLLWCTCCTTSSPFINRRLQSALRICSSSACRMMARSDLGGTNRNRGLDEILLESANYSSSWSVLVLQSYTEVSARIAHCWETSGQSEVFLSAREKPRAHWEEDVQLWYHVDCKDSTDSYCLANSCRCH